jgi:hypothetical protein
MLCVHLPILVHELLLHWVTVWSSSVRTCWTNFCFYVAGIINSVFTNASWPDVGSIQRESEVDHSLLSHVEVNVYGFSALCGPSWHGTRQRRIAFLLVLTKKHSLCLRHEGPEWATDVSMLSLKIYAWVVLSVTRLKAYPARVTQFLNRMGLVWRPQGKHPTWRRMDRHDVDTSTACKLFVNFTL